MLLKGLKSFAFLNNSKYTVGFSVSKDEYHEAKFESS